MTNKTKQEEFFLKAGFHKHKQSYRGKGLYYSVGGYDITKSDAEQIMKAVNQQVLEALEEVKSKTSSTFITPTNGVPLSAIEEIEKRYRNE